MPFLDRITQYFIRRYAVRANVRVGRGVHIGPGSILYSASLLNVGDGTYIGKGCTIQVGGNIGRGCLIANRVGIVGRRDHDLRQVGLPMSFTDWIGDPQSQLHGSDQVEIGEDVWVGYGAIILSGVKIGRGAVVAAGSLVIRDIPPYTIAGGSPAHPIGNRFRPDEIVEHEAKALLFWQQWNGQSRTNYRRP